ncbi:MAG: proline dehydrogenase family protein [Candidatus Dormibacter sp.]|uniref:proline dehydrogenase family protein n=1 Tax=Candidatus Dormibacter sp. TaxID=2973982 RepID=UPI000DB0D02B|nr:MAG: proline dehydrogenase [Candidatus Dormibacteraeota bacterium]
MPRLLDRAMASTVPLLPRGIVRRVSERYIAGETLADALATVRRLSAGGCLGTVDLLGEHVTSREQPLATKAAYREAIQRLAEEKLPAGVSVKPTAFGLAVDREVCLQNLREVAAAAAEHGRFMRVDMEESHFTSSTLELVHELHDEHANVGAVIQARLRRSPDDIERLLRERISVRLCKGIYQEPPAVALQDFDQIRIAYLRLLDRLLQAACYVGIATHDRWLAERSLEIVRHHGRGRDQYEFQMLMGVAEPLRRRLVAAGHRVRIYVPYGGDWYAYSLRRLQENPQIATSIALSLIGRATDTSR